jgi:hypothetical protein
MSVEALIEQLTDTLFRAKFGDPDGIHPIRRDQAMDTCRERVFEFLVLSKAYAKAIKEMKS